jgi:hypothetical protein
MAAIRRTEFIPLDRIIVPRTDGRAKWGSREKNPFLRPAAAVIAIERNKPNPGHSL